MRRLLCILLLWSCLPAWALAGQGDAGQGDAGRRAARCEPVAIMDRAAETELPSGGDSFCGKDAIVGDLSSSGGERAAELELPSGGDSFRGKDSIVGDPSPGGDRAAELELPSGGDRAAEILSGLAAGFRALPAYEVGFGITAGEHTLSGSYAVEGERYYLRLGDAEVYSDGAARYEVDNRRREVTIDLLDTGSRNLLDNPVHAFDLLGSQYLAALLWERDGRAAVRLTPAEGNDTPAGNVTVTVETDAMRPLSLLYDYDGEQILITIQRVAAPGAPIPVFATERYPDYEVIDFR